MRHRKGNQKLSLPTDQRLALLASLLRSLVIRGKIQTTLHRARATARLADRCIELGKDATLPGRRKIFSMLKDRDLVSKVCNEIAPRFKDRQGGYARVIKAGRRLGDGAQTAILTLAEPVTAA